MWCSARLGHKYAAESMDLLLYLPPGPPLYLCGRHQSLFLIPRNSAQWIAEPFSTSAIWEMPRKAIALSALSHAFSVDVWALDVWGLCTSRLFCYLFIYIYFVIYFTVNDKFAKNDCLVVVILYNFFWEMMSERLEVGSWGMPCSGIKWGGTRRLWVSSNTGLNLPWLILTISCFQQLGLQEWTGRICPKLAFAVRRKYFIYKPSACANSRGKQVFPSAGAEQMRRSRERWWCLPYWRALE